MVAIAFLHLMAALRMSKQTPGHCCWLLLLLLLFCSSVATGCRVVGADCCLGRV